MKYEVTRRDFLGQAACAGVTMLPVLSTLLNLRASGQAAAAAAVPGGAKYRALVCVFLGGGNDSFNMLVPCAGEAFEKYAATRSDVALSAGEILPLCAAGERHPALGLHNAMPEMEQLFAEKKLAFVANVGTLVRPVTLRDFRARLWMPRGLFSHADQAQQWMTAVSDRRETAGWAGRLREYLERPSDLFSMNISLSGSNLFQQGRATTAFSLGPDGPVSLSSFDGGALPGEGEAVRSLLEQEYSHLLRQAHSDITRRAVDDAARFAAALGEGDVATPFPSTRIGRQLRMVARTMAARERLGVSRQIFFVHRNGWDHHAEVLETQATMLRELSEALEAFHLALLELGVWDDAVVFTASDFARTLTSNGRGTDHAWGGNQLVFGGAVRGGKIYGEYPDLALGGSLDTGRGRLIPTTSVDEYSAMLARWLGVTDGDLVEIFPNLEHFGSVSEISGRLGFLG